MKIELGQKITVSQRLKRVETHNQTLYKTWKSVLLSKPKECIVVGERTLSNGYISFEDYDGGVARVYTAKEYFRAVMVVERLSSKPFFTLINQ